jgi:hypothetical protein
METTKQEIIEKLSMQIGIKDKEIQELKDLVNGNVKANGYKWLDNHGNIRWEINTSSILTKLIKIAGRLCDDYASDLFILWSCDIDEPLKAGNMESQTFVFAFYDSGIHSGIHHKCLWDIYKDDDSYYREVWFLDVTINGDKISMDLHK